MVEYGEGSQEMPVATCPHCGYKGVVGDSMRLIAVWENYDDHEVGLEPDHLGCKQCGTLTPWGELE